MDFIGFNSVKYLRYRLLNIIIIVLILELFLINISYSQTQDDTLRASQKLEKTQQQQQNYLKNNELGLQQKLREQNKTKLLFFKDMQHENDSKNIIKNESGMCVQVGNIVLDGADILVGKERDNIINKYLNNNDKKQNYSLAKKLRTYFTAVLGTNTANTPDENTLNEPELNHGNSNCLTLSAINQLMSDITNYYSSKNYVAAKVTLPAQDLKSGILKLQVIEGAVENVILNENKWYDKLQVFTSFPAMKNKALNLRDVEQGLDQINRLTSSNASMQIVPGAKPGETKIVLSDKTDKKTRFTIGYDNSGQKSTGENKAIYGLERDNLLGLGETFALNYNNDTSANSGLKNSEIYSGNFSIPFGYWNFSATGSNSKYIQTSTPSNGQKFSYSGRTNIVGGKIDRVLFRGQDSKISGSTALKLKDTKAYQNAGEQITGSHDLTVLSLGLDYTLRGLGNVFFVGGNYERGLTAFAADKDPENILPDQPKSQFDKYLLDASFYRPFSINDIKFAVRSSAAAQFSQDHLLPLERMSVGDRYTVRGYGDSSLIGDTGFYLRNELVLNASDSFMPEFSSNKYVKKFVGNLQPYIAYDYGSARLSQGKNRENGIVTGYLSGYAVGVRNDSENLSFDLAYAKPLNHPYAMQPDNNEIYFMVATKIGF